MMTWLTSERAIASSSDNLRWQWQPSQLATKNSIWRNMRGKFPAFMPRMFMRQAKCWWPPAVFPTRLGPHSTHWLKYTWLYPTPNLNPNATSTLPHHHHHHHHHPHPQLHPVPTGRGLGTTRAESRFRVFTAYEGVLDYCVFTMDGTNPNSSPSPYPYEIYRMTAPWWRQCGKPVEKTQ